MFAVFILNILIVTSLGWRQFLPVLGCNYFPSSVQHMLRSNTISLMYSFRCFISLDLCYFYHSLHIKFMVNKKFPSLTIGFPCLVFFCPSEMYSSYLPPLLLWWSVEVNVVWWTICVLQFFCVLNIFKKTTCDL